MKRMMVAGALVVVSFPLLGYVWGQNGHRVVGEIADRHLTLQARQRITELLDGQSLAQVGTWADEIRSDTSWGCAAPFHYVTLPPGAAYPENLAPGGDAIRAVAFFEGVLTDPHSARADRQRALKFLVHFVGDMHQPLHIGRGCDRGGNDVRVSWFGESTNLHAVWDTKLIESEDLSFTELVRFLGNPTAEQVGTYQHATPLDWAHDAQRYLDGVYTCYTGFRGGDRCPCFCGQCSGGRSTFGGCTATQCSLQIPDEVRLNFQYAYRNKPIVWEQLRKGGVRLAGMLNWIFADNSEPPANYREFKRKLEAVDGWAAPFEACTANR